ncbi:transposon tf2-12 polyprotein [Plakobranchus ocellatus]|uniref:Transposon tf2-12 polyprotein n=1 Tax=Plakobranchus ocellatus TaxID=259542 RepID=A0AAV4DZ04_9GAST|nr:transposon tf2-12 polyprotein [Plakobranchus ocellatus]
MDDLGIWEATDKSSWVHHMVTVPKPNGDYRIATGLSPLNRYVVLDRFPLPNPNDLFLELRGANVFTKLDLRKAFFHIELAPDSRHLTTTLTHQGLRQYKRLPMGLKDSASVCQRLVSQTLADCPGTIAYIDDILIFGSTRAEHDANLRMALQRLSDKDFRLQLAKCKFTVPKVTFLGHVISANGI